MKNSSKKSKNTKSKSPTPKPFPTSQSIFDPSTSHSIDIDSCNTMINPLPLSSPMNAPLIMTSHPKQNKKIEQIDIVDFEFRPKKVKIETNTLVRWTIGENKANHESGIYSSNTRNFVLVIDALEVESDLLIKGETFEHCFTAAGIYEIGCSNYPRMKGKVEVYEEGKENDLEQLQELELKKRGLYKTRTQFEENFESQYSNRHSVQTSEKKKVGVHPMVEHFPSYNPHDLQALINELHAQDMSQSKPTYREQQLEQLEKIEKEKQEKVQAQGLPNQFGMSDSQVNFLDSIGNFPEGGCDEYSSYSDYEYDKVSEFDLSNILKARKISSPLSLPPVSIFEEQKVGDTTNFIPQVINVFAVDSGSKEPEKEIEKERKEEVLGQNEGKIENNSAERASDKSDGKENEQRKESIEKNDQENQENQFEKENVEEKKKKKKSKTKNKKKKKVDSISNLEEQGSKEEKGNSIENKKEIAQAKSIEEIKNNTVVQNHVVQEPVKEVEIKAKEPVIEKQNERINSNIEREKSQTNSNANRNQKQREQAKSITKEKSLGNVMRNGQDSNDREKKNTNRLRTEYVPKAVQSSDKVNKDQAKAVVIEKPQTPVIIEEKIELKTHQIEEKKLDKQISKSDEFFAFIKKSTSEFMNNNRRNSRNNKKYKAVRQEEPSNEELERLSMLKAFLMNRFEFSETFS